MGTLTSMVVKIHRDNLKGVKDEKGIYQEQQ
jgi:hypothetical protein